MAAQAHEGAEGATGLRGGQKGGEGQDLSSGGDAGADADACDDAEAIASPVRVETTEGEVFEADAVVLAVGITAAKVQYYTPFLPSHET